MCRIETRIAEAKQQQTDEILARNLQKEFDMKEKEREDTLKRDYLLARMVAERQSAIQYTVNINLKIKHKIARFSVFLSNNQMQLNGQVIKVSGNPSSLANFSLLPTYTYKQTSDVNVEECMICLDKYEPNCKVTHLLCSHKYHTECIRKWLSNNSNCPFCHTNAITGL